MLLSHFPPEIGLRILKELLPMECQNILDIITAGDSSASPEHFKNKEVTCWLYSRMFGNTLVVYFDGSGPPTGSDFAATTDEMLIRCKDEMFLANSPKHLSFRLVRDYQEVARFQAALKACEKIIDNAELAQYYTLIPRISFHVNGRYSSEVCSTLMLVAISCLLLKLTKLKDAQVKAIAVVGTNIGDMFPEKWDKVFNCYTAMETLILEDNCLKFPDHVNLKADLDFKWPANLKHLSLAGNKIRSFSMSAMRNLPSSLETLNISKNDISFFGPLDGDTFDLSLHLPRMRNLDLSDSRSLARIDPSIFCGSQNARKLTLNLCGCNLAPQNWDELEQLARAEYLTLVR